jgi:rare lipoprotein A (peptidoglycan hydrolase)
MRLNYKIPAPLLALIAGLALPTAALGASSGGAAAPSPTTPSPATSPAAKVHTSGIATWFGPGFYGQKTACGQTLTPGVVGVANRTLPCGTLIKVTYDGHALTVPVLDRGPYSHIGADWDLTAGAATALGITETVRIGTHVVGSAPNTPTLGLPPAEASSPLAGGALAG